MDKDDEIEVNLGITEPTRGHIGVFEVVETEQTRVAVVLCVLELEQELVAQKLGDAGLAHQRDLPSIGLDDENKPQRHARHVHGGTGLPITTSRISH